MKHYLHGRTHLGESSLCPSTPPPHALKVATFSPSAQSAPVPGVEVIKQGDKVVRLVVTCTCGERIEIECLYPNSG